MRVVVQRVTEARVRSEGEVLGSVGRGLLLMVGLAPGDDEATLAWVARKVVGLRIFADDAGLMNASLVDVAGAVLAVPQFTLLGDCRKGRRPSFAGAMLPAEAEPLFRRFVALLEAQGVPVAAGRFGAAMAVELVNDGPVTLIVDR